MREFYFRIWKPPKPDVTHQKGEWSIFILTIGKHLVYVFNHSSLNRERDAAVTLPCGEHTCVWRMSEALYHPANLIGQIALGTALRVSIVYLRAARYFTQIWNAIKVRNGLNHSILFPIQGTMVTYVTEMFPFIGHFDAAVTSPYGNAIQSCLKYLR